MERHDLDLTALVAGVVFTVIGVVGLVGPLVNVDVDGAWVVPLLLVLVGSAGLVATVGRLRRLEQGVEPGQDTSSPDADDLR